VNSIAPKDALHNSGGAVVARIGMGYKAFFAANSTATGKKSNAVDRPSPCCYSPQGFIQGIPKRGVLAGLQIDNLGFFVYSGLR